MALEILGYFFAVRMAAGLSRVLNPDLKPGRFTAAASRPSSAVRPDASSLPASAPLAAGAVHPAAHAAFPKKEEEECVGAAKARSSEELGAAQQAHSDWAPADCSAAQSVYGWSPGDPADSSARLPANASIPADHSAQPGLGERCHSLDALAYWPLAEPRPDWLAGCKAFLPLWPGRLPGRSMLPAWE